MDNAHLWLPYTQMKTAPEPLRAVRTEGCRIILDDGRELIDGIASWWTACHGYNHPHIRDAMEEQLAAMPHVMFAGLVHEPAQALAAKLAAKAPPGLKRVFFSDSGSTAVEVALKMAVQYWRNRGQPRRTKFIAFHHGYHGDTMGALSVSDPRGWLHGASSQYFPLQYHIDIPLDELSFSEFRDILDDIARSAAALLIEPLVQCVGHMRFHSADVLAEIYRIAKEHDLLVIADEIATGFGRTGYFFACEEAGITPDILCVGKALTGGAIPLAATLATEEVFGAFYGDELTMALMHGPTYMANPLACRAALASLELFEQEPRLAQVARLEERLREGLEPCRNLPVVRDVRVKGAIGVVQIDPQQVDIFALRSRFVEEGCWIRPFADVVYLMPPFVISDEELDHLTGAIHRLLSRSET